MQQANPDLVEQLRSQMKTGEEAEGAIKPASDDVPKPGLTSYLLFYFKITSKIRSRLALCFRHTTTDFNLISINEGTINSKAVSPSTNSIS